MLEAVLPPLIAAYAVFVAMVIVAWRRPAARSDGGNDTHRSSRGSILGTTAGGYVSFLAIVLIFHVWLAGEADALADAVWGGGFLAAVTLGLAATSVAFARRGSRRR